jgi:putative SOS response-associated peptidase YedK
MCGRFVLDSPVDIIVSEFGVERPTFNLKKSFNIAPSQTIQILMFDSKRKLVQCRWGYIPSWSKDESIGYKMINARAETIAEKRSFKNAFKKRRCLIIADGFYEWRHKENAKSPFFIHLKSKRPFGLAGLYNVWTSPDGNPLCTCTIITTEANRSLREVHNRMPAIISKKKYDMWLNPEIIDSGDLLPLLRPYPADEIEYYEVSNRVNSPKNDSPENIQPLHP